MDDFVEIVVFGEPDDGGDRGAELYVSKHRLTSGEQTLTITVPGRPASVGVDPYYVQIDRRSHDNLTTIEIGES